MAKIKTNAHKLTVDEQIAMGDHVIAKGTNNNDVTGNTDQLTAFTTKHTALKTASAAATAARLASKQATTQLNAMKKDWLGGLNGLASITESLTSGDPVKIQGAGFDVRSASAPVPVPGQVTNLTVALNGQVGYSDLTWNPLAEADHYVIQTSIDPTTDASWTFVTTATGASYHGNGATAGQKRWYRVAGINANGQGPWSDPAMRPVM